MFDPNVLEDDGFILAWTVAAGEMMGLEFDWSSFTWRKKP